MGSVLFITKLSLETLLAFKVDTQFFLLKVMHDYGRDSGKYKVYIYDILRYR